MTIIRRQVTLAAVASTMLIVAIGPARAQTIDWARQFGTAERDVAQEVAVDTAGNVYVAGMTSGVLTGAGGVGFSGAFLARFDVVGNLVWVRASDGAAGLATDRAGFVYVAGGSDHALVAKYNGDGVCQWVRTFGVPGFDSATATGVATDLAGDVYVVGTASQAAAPPPSSQNNSFLAKYDSSGTQLWFQTTGGSPCCNRRHMSMWRPLTRDMCTSPDGRINSPRAQV
jgi:Beta-propeller repeat